MKRFIIKTILIFLPLLIFIMVVMLCVDFFKIIGFQDYYPTSQPLTLNREMVTTTTYNHFREKERFNSFIFGSSRSQAYKCCNWIKYLGQDAKPFHFDANAESLWGITKKIEYVDEIGDSIKNALVIIDRFLLVKISPQKGHLFIAMPCVSKHSKAEYYMTFLKASFSPNMLEDFMKKDKNIFIANPKNCDVWYGYDKKIKSDSILYYQNILKQGVFKDRDNRKSTLEVCNVTPEEILQLKRIRNIFDKHNTNYKIVVSPIYDQVPIEKEQLDLLYEIFGKDKVYNFSGKNDLTEEISNYYETSHYRPHIADTIMRRIYAN